MDLRGRTDLYQLAEVLRGADLVIAHDSGVMHVAVAVDARLIALYGPTDFDRTGPRSRKADVIFLNTLPLGIMATRGDSEIELAGFIQITNA